MELSRLRGGGTPFVTNVPVTSAAAVLDGVILTMTATSTTAGPIAVSATSTSAIGAGAIGVTQVSTAQASAAPENVNNMSAARFNIDTDGIPNRAATDGWDWVPTLINADAQYYASCSNSTANNAAMNVGISATTGTQLTVLLTGVANRVGGWVMDGSNVALSSAGGTPTFNGQLRMCTVNVASTLFGLKTAMNASTDSNIVFVGTPWRKQVELTDDGTQLSSMSTTTAAALASNVMRIENYVKHQNAPMHPLRGWVDDGLNGLSGANLFSELALTGHAIVTQAASA